MFFPQTLSEYLDNPMGKGSTAIWNRKTIQFALDSRYDELLKKHKDFQFTVYSTNTDYFFHFLIPTETDRNNTYDVIIQFTQGEEDLSSEPTLSHYYLKFFSNSPAFSFTFAYVYKDYELLIDFLKDKYTKEMIKDAPIVRNPGEIINYEKSLYFACSYLKNHKSLLKKSTLSTMATPLNVKELIKLVRTHDQIMLEIKKEENRLKQEKEQRKKDEKKKLEDKVNKLDSKKISGFNILNKHNKSSAINKIKPKPKIKAKRSTNSGNK